MKKNFFISKIVIALFFFLFGFLSVYVVPYDLRMPLFNVIANKIVAECAHEKNLRHLCYDREIVKLLGPFSLKTVSTITKMVQKKDSMYVTCHTMGHMLGSKALKLSNSNWIDVIQQYPSNMCSYGCMHGVILEQFNQR